MAKTTQEDAKTKYLFAQVRDINEKDRTLEAVASTSDRDRHGDIILPSAFTETLPSFKANPVILATHQHRLSTGSSPVIGSAFPDSITVGDEAVTFRMQFATTDLGEEYWKLYREKHMRAFSIGFIPIEWTDEKDENLGYIRTYTKIELLEISAVPVPSNRRALARVKGLYHEDEITDVLKDLLTAEMAKLTGSVNQCKSVSEELRTEVEESLEEIKTLLTPDQDGLGRSLLGDPRNQSGPGGAKETAERIGTKLQDILSH